LLFGFLLFLFIRINNPADFFPYVLINLLILGIALSAKNVRIRSNNENNIIILFSKFSSILNDLFNSDVNVLELFNEIGEDIAFLLNIGVFYIIYELLNYYYYL
jgi:hypothetical protein